MRDSFLFNFKYRKQQRSIDCLALHAQLCSVHPLAMTLWVISKQVLTC